MGPTRVTTDGGTTARDGGGASPPDAGKPPRDGGATARSDAGSVGPGQTGACTSGRDHLLRAHTRVAQKTGKANLPSAVATHPADADAGLTDTDQPRQQAGPPFSRRRSPNRPKLPSISAPESHRSIIDSDNGARRKRPVWRCVHIVGLDRATRYSREFVI